MFSLFLTLSEKLNSNFHYLHIESDYMTIPHKLDAFHAALGHLTLILPVEHI